MGNYKLIVCGVHPFRERVGDGLWQGLGVWGPCHHHLGAFLGLVFLDGDKVGETLQRMARGGLHGEDRAPGVFDELADYALLIILGLVFETGERTDAYDVAVASHHGYRFKEVFGPVSVHYHAALGFEFPCALVYVEDYHVHPEVESRLLGAEARAERGVEEYHHEGLVAPEVGEREAVGFEFEGFLYGGVKRAYVVYVCEMFHSLEEFFEC